MCSYCCVVQIISKSTDMESSLKHMLKVDDVLNTHILSTNQEQESDRCEDIYRQCCFLCIVISNKLVSMIEQLALDYHR